MSLPERREAHPDAAPPPEAFRPFIPPEVKLPELTVLPVIVGTLLGAVFGASSLYLTLKVGLTVSASIPVAVISVTLFRLLAKVGRSATILENNIVQTAGSAGESLAFGIGVTMPAILILGFDLEVGRTILVSLLGGLLGILMMIPLRRAMIVEQHGRLKFPEGTACAEVLKASATPEEVAIASRGGSVPVETAGLGARTILAGFGVGLLYKTAMKAFYAWKEIPEKVFGAPLKAGSVGMEISPELLGVGYIIGPRIASIMAAGGVLAYLVLIPAIKFFGEAAAGAIPPGTIPVRDMTPDDIRGAYVLYIGAGAVAAGGIISLVRALPTIWRGIRGGLADLGAGRRDSAAVPRTDRDLPMKLVVIGCVALVGLILIFRSLHMNLLGAILIVLLGFLFVTVSARLTGEIGSTSNPISGMTVATLLVTSLVFLAVGWTGPTYYVTALSVGAIVCIACSNGGTIAQSLKTGHLLGATPKSQQIAILFGSALAALALGPVLLLLNANGTVYVPVADAPGLRVPPAVLQTLKTESLRGPQARDDGASYRVWFKTDAAGGPAGRYLVNGQGVPVYLVDPGINGVHRERPDGTQATKFDAPKATLVSYIIKGILNRELPWGLVLLGVMIAVVLEMSGIPSLAFAVGLYLPLSASTPILAGGLVRWLVDRGLQKRLAHRNLSEEELAAESDKSPGVLMASGYIAGGAIAGIVIAFMAGVLTDFNESVTQLMDRVNPFFSGPYADALALIPFAVLVVVLYLTGREVILAGRKG
ncbi:MAG TPA: oligopeptide transporter, OPT family [Thermoanaerobaculia bacterium]